MAADANREATLTVSLAPGAFQGGLRKMVSWTRDAGRDMGQALKEPINQGLKSAGKEIGGMFSSLKDGLRTVGTLGGAIAIGSFIRDAATLRQMYSNIAFEVNKVQGNAEDWRSIQRMVQDEVERTGQKAEGLADSFTKVFRETGSIDAARRAMAVAGTTATATGKDVGLLGDAVQIAMTKFNIKTPEEAMARILSGTGLGGKQIDQLGGSFEMLGEAAAASGHTGGAAMCMMLNLIASIGDKAEPGLMAMFQTMKSGSSQVLKLQKEMGHKIKFTADMSALDRVRTTLSSDKGRKAAEKMFRGDARIVYDKLAEPFDLAYKQAIESGADAKTAMKAGFAAFDKNLIDAGKSTIYYEQIQKEAAARISDDPGKKLDMAVEKIRLAFTKPEMMAALDKLAVNLPKFADIVVTIIEKVVNNPWETIAVLVGGKIALAFASTAITNVITAGMTSLFARMAAVQAASSALGVGGAVATGAAGAAGGGGLLAGGGAIAATVATAATGVLAAGAAGAAVGYGIYKYGGVENRQNKEFDAARAGQELLMNTRGAKSEKQILSAMSELKKAKGNLDQGSVMNSIVGFLARPFMEGGAEGLVNPTAKVSHQIDAETLRLTQSLKRLREGVEANSELRSGPPSSARGPMRPADPTPGSRPVGG